MYTGRRQRTINRARSDAKGTDIPVSNVAGCSFLRVMRLDVRILVNIFNRISDCRGETRLNFALDESLDEASFLFCLLVSLRPL